MFSPALNANCSCTLALHLFTLIDASRCVVDLSASSCTSRCVSSVLPSVAASASSYTVLPLHLALVLPPGLTWTSAWSLGLTLGSSGSLSGSLSRCSLLLSLPGPSSTLFNVSGVAASTLSALPHSLVLSASSGSSVSSSG